MAKSLLKLSDLSKAEVRAFLNKADQLKFEQKNGIKHKILEGKTLAMIFSKASTRTRVSFEVGMYQLGGHALFLSANDLQIGRGEPVEDTARVMFRYVDGIMIRTFKQQEVEDLAEFSGLPVINGLTDYAHPCQALADLMTIREQFAYLEGLNACFMGDGGNNTCNSFIVGCVLSDMNITVGCPKGYEPHPDVLKWAGDKVKISHDPKEAVKNADVVYTDVWASMGQEDQRKIRLEALKDYQVNMDLLKLASPDVIVQHCLPAHRGEELTAEVFDKHAKVIFDEAENRLHIQKAIMAILMG
ncbi:MAG: ornithine carbamoyltransferase [Treponema sp.]|nr:ornithine carbamoyltransferase [Treponema sp.]